MKVPRYSEIKTREVTQRRLIVAARGSRQAKARQSEVSLVGTRGKWRITNLRRVAVAMAKWA